MNFLRRPQYEWSHSIILIINLDSLFICFIIGVNNFDGFLILFQEQANCIAADQISPLEINIICLRHRASSSVLDTSEAFMTTGSEYVSVYRKCLLLVPIPCLDMKNAINLIVLVITSLKPSMKCGMMLPSTRVRLDSGPSKEAQMGERSSIPLH